MFDKRFRKLKNGFKIKRTLEDAGRLRMLDAQNAMSADRKTGQSRKKGHLNNNKDTYLIPKNDTKNCF